MVEGWREARASPEGGAAVKLANRPEAVALRLGRRRHDRRHRRRRGLPRRPSAPPGRGEARPPQVKIEAAAGVVVPRRLRASASPCRPKTAWRSPRQGFVDRNTVPGQRNSPGLLTCRSLRTCRRAASGSSGSESNDQEQGNDDDDQDFGRGDPSRPCRASPARVRRRGTFTVVSLGRQLPGGLSTRPSSPSRRRAASPGDLRISMAASASCAPRPRRRASAGRGAGGIGRARSWAAPKAVRDHRL